MKLLSPSKPVCTRLWNYTSTSRSCSGILKEPFPPLFSLARAEPVLKMPSDATGSWSIQLGFKGRVWPDSTKLRSWAHLGQTQAWLARYLVTERNLWTSFFSGQLFKDTVGVRSRMGCDLAYFEQMPSAASDIISKHIKTEQTCVNNRRPQVKVCPHIELGSPSSLHIFLTMKASQQHLVQVWVCIYVDFWRRSVWLNKLLDLSVRLLSNKYA